MTEPAYRTISDVATLVGVPHHVLRFWETKFPSIAPLKRGGNRRYYRPADVATIAHVARLLHIEGYTIKGAQKLLADEAGAPAVRICPAAPVPEQPATDAASTGIPVAAITSIRDTLAAALAAARAL